MSDPLLPMPDQNSSHANQNAVHSTDDESAERSRSDLLAKSQSSEWNSVDDVLFENNQKQAQSVSIDEFQNMI